MKLEWIKRGSTMHDCLQCEHKGSVYQIISIPDDSSAWVIILRDSVRIGMSVSIEEAKQFVIDNLEE